MKISVLGNIIETENIYQITEIVGNGCWNSCYTPTAKYSNYLNLNALKSVIKSIKR